MAEVHTGLLTTLHPVAPSCAGAGRLCVRRPHVAKQQLPLSQQSRGADPTIKTEDYDPYLNPGPKTPLEVRLSVGSY